MEEMEMPCPVSLHCNFCLQLSVCVHNWPEGKQEWLGGNRPHGAQIAKSPAARPKIVKIFLYRVRHVDMNKMQNSEMLLNCRSTCAEEFPRLFIAFSRVRS